MIQFSDVRARVRGAWLACLHDLSSGLGDAVARPGCHVPCPVHGGRDGFRLYRDAADTGGGVCNTCGAHPDGFALLSWANGWTLVETLRAVARWAGVDSGGDDAPIRRTAPKPAPVVDAGRERGKLAAVWGDAVALDHPAAEPVRRYLSNRSLGWLGEVNGWPAPDAVRCHRALPYWTATDAGTVKLGEYPAMLAAVRGLDGRAVGLHCTYLTPDGQKAVITDPVTGEPLPVKKMRSVGHQATNGAAIRLYPCGDRLGVAEGIETALAVRVAWPDLPIWATVSAGGMQRLDLPKVQELVILADNDASDTGQRAAAALSERATATGVRVRVAMPTSVGQDWADVLGAIGPAALRWTLRRAVSGR